MAQFFSVSQMADSELIVPIEQVPGSVVSAAKDGSTV